MAEMKDIIKIAVDAYHGNVEQYSVGQSMELLQKALIEANGGSTTLNYKNIRDGKCSGLFTLIEEVLSRTVVEGLQGDEYFNALVDFRNVAEGDKNSLKWRTAPCSSYPRQRTALRASVVSGLAASAKCLFPLH